MRCLAAGYEERRRQRQRWRCCGDVQVPVANQIVGDGVLVDCGGGGLWAVARPVQVPESAQNETTSVPAARTQCQRVLNHRQRTAGRPRPTQRLQVHGVGTQLQYRHRVQRRRRHRR